MEPPCPHEAVMVMNDLMRFVLSDIFFPAIVI
jgi:hypothetical protein